MFLPDGGGLSLLDQYDSVVRSRCYTRTQACSFAACHQICESIRDHRSWSRLGVCWLGALPTPRLGAMQCTNSVCCGYNSQSSASYGKPPFDLDAGRCLGGNRSQNRGRFLLVQGDRDRCLPKEEIRARTVGLARNSSLRTYFLAFAGSFSPTLLLISNFTLPVFLSTSTMT
jgi:hypothetical protein